MSDAVSDSGPIESVTQFKDTPQGQQQRWTIEITAAKENQKDWWNDGDRCVKRYLGQRDGEGKATLNLFHANVNTTLAMLYGQLPQVDVARRFADAQDDDARVGGEMMERVLQTDLEREDDGFTSALRYNLQDWKTAGLGQSWLRYVVETEKRPEQPAQTRPDPMTGEEVEVAPAVPETEVKTFEDVETDYIHWKDFLWQPARTWHEVTWVAKRVEMTRDELKTKFGDEKAKLVSMQKRQPQNTEGLSADIKDAWNRAEVYEVWCKETKTVYWWSDGMSEILKSEKDPLGLEDFWPCPRPLFANSTTSKLMPKPDFLLAEHLYNEIDDLSARIKNLEDCAKVRWAYDKANSGLKRIFTETAEGEGVPIENWAAFAQNGGIDGAMSFTPLKEIVQAIQLLTEKRQEKVAFLYQVTGLSDIVRGQAAQKATATEQRIKANFASTRLQTEQDEVARYATDIQKIRAEIISKHFDPETIVKRSNILNTQDRDRAQQGVAFIKGQFWQYRVDVKADSIALRDYASLKQERVETVQTLAMLFKEVLPAVQLFPPLGPFVLAVGEWLIAATKGSQQLEADFDKFRAMAEQAAQAAMQPKPPPPDPKVEHEKIKMQATKQKAQLDAQGKSMDLQIKREELGMKRQEMAMDAQARQEGMALDREERMQDHAMQAEEHAMHREQMHMGMHAQRVATDEKIRAAKAKPKGKERE